MRDGSYGQYACQITGNILFHSVPYTTKYDKGSLEYWEFDQLGTACSQGCVRLQVKDAKWVYDHFYSIVGVEFYCSDDPGPLGKPSAPTISGNERCRGWDPTDPDPKNPWLQPDPDAGTTPASTPAADEIPVIIETEPAQTAAPAATPEPEITAGDEVFIEP